MALLRIAEWRSSGRETLETVRVLIATLLLLILYLQFRLWIGEGSYAWLTALDNEIEQQEAENAGLEMRNAFLYEEIDQLKHGLDAVEDHARSQLGLIREGETFYMILDEDNQSSDRRPGGADEY